jgi:hypothetical protein
MLVNLPLNFPFSKPGIRFPLNSKGSLIVEALVKALENASVPKAEIRFKPGAHLFFFNFSNTSLQYELGIPQRAKGG